MLTGFMSTIAGLDLGRAIYQPRGPKVSRYRLMGDYNRMSKVKYQDRNKYSGTDLREMRAENGVGRPPKHRR